MKTATITLTDIKSEGWGEVGFELGMNEDTIGDVFEYGEYGNLELEIDENLNVTGKVIPFKN